MARMFGLKVWSSLVSAATRASYSTSMILVSLTLVLAAASRRSSCSSAKSTCRRAPASSKSCSDHASRSRSWNSEPSNRSSWGPPSSGTSICFSWLSRKTMHLMLRSRRSLSLNLLTFFLMRSTSDLILDASVRFAFKSLSTCSCCCLKSWIFTELASTRFARLASCTSSFACLSLLSSMSRLYCSQSRRKASIFAPPRAALSMFCASATRHLTFSSCSLTDSLHFLRRRCSWWTTSRMSCTPSSSFSFAKCLLPTFNRSASNVSFARSISFRFAMVRSVFAFSSSARACKLDRSSCSEARVASELRRRRPAAAARSSRSRRSRSRSEAWRALRAICSESVAKSLSTHSSFAACCWISCNSSVPPNSTWDVARTFPPSTDMLPFGAMTSPCKVTTRGVSFRGLASWKEVRVASSKSSTTIVPLSKNSSAEST
mmetsp:Transcript_16129/g.56240  ORF Transcript_16129/g.56240 Transcript_16129/m.56240 type:complete len:432 (+) Transcript_16129:1177-2472(+)